MNTTERLAEIKALCEEYRKLRPNPAGNFRAEYWENDYQAKHRFDLAVNESTTGAKFANAKYIYQPIRRG